MVAERRFSSPPAKSFVLDRLLSVMSYSSTHAVVLVLFLVRNFGLSFLAEWRATLFAPLHLAPLRLRSDN